MDAAGSSVRLRGALLCGERRGRGKGNLMVQRTSIEWTDRSSNAIRARRKDNGKVGHHCVMISPGCAHCYSQRWNQWVGTHLPFTKHSVDQIEMLLDTRVFRALLKLKDPQRVFMYDMTDLFGDWVPDEWIDHTFAVAAMTPHITYQILTKRAERLPRYYADLARARARWAEIIEREYLELSPCLGHLIDDLQDSEPTPLSNVWHGVSVENQACADERIRHLVKIPAAVLFLSVEPLLGSVGLTRLDNGCGETYNALTAEVTTHRGHTFRASDTRPIDWVIVGGESGHGARACDLQWIRSIVKQCRDADTHCFVKQLGSKPIGTWQPLHGTDTLAISSPAFDGHWRLNDKKGGDLSEMPEDLRVREFPTVVMGAMS